MKRKKTSESHITSLKTNKFTRLQYTLTQTVRVRHRNSGSHILACDLSYNISLIEKLVECMDGKKDDLEVLL